MNRLRGMPLRVWAVVGTVVVVVASVGVVVAAYTGWTVGLGTHDRAATVTVALTAAALLAGLVAVALALAAYWAASGVPDLSVEIVFNFSEPNKPKFKVRSPDASGWLPIEPYKQADARVIVRNASNYAARNPGVRIRLRGMAHRQAVSGWTTTQSVNMLGIVEVQWDGGADQIIHGMWERTLPNFSMYEGYVLPHLQPAFEVTVVADGVPPRTVMLPVEVVTG